VVHYARRSERVGPPRRRDQLVAAQHPPACANEAIQQLELDRRQFHRPSSQAQFAAREIHLHLAKAAALRLRFPARAPPSSRPTSNPPLPGSITSSKIRSKPPSRARRAAVMPSRATSTSYPSILKSSSSPSAIAGSSSTISMRLMFAPERAAPPWT